MDPRQNTSGWAAAVHEFICFVIRQLETLQINYDEMFSASAVDLSTAVGWNY